METPLPHAMLPSQARRREDVGAAGKPLATPWNKFLPADWADLVEAPLHFQHYSEYEIDAQRTVGYDADDQPCFTAHQFMLTSLASDDDEEFYEVVTYCEEMAAWRLRDERWLIFRMVGTGQGNPPRGFYSLSPEMPR